MHELPREHWYVVAQSRQLGRKRPLALRRLGLELVFWRDTSGRAWAQLDHCPHRSARLSAGRIRGDEIECPFHGFRFDGSGACMAVPCEGPEAHRAHLRNRSFPLREEHGFLWMWWGDGSPDEAPLPWFEELRADMRYAEQIREWETGWQRAVENQLDWAHLPFVHRNSIGIGFPHELEIHSELEDGEIFTYPQHMVAEDGRPSFYLRFRFPNIWMNPAGPKSFIFIAFAPIDATHTCIYVRTYQYMFRLPVLSHLYGYIMSAANAWIIGQDQRVVATQPPRVEDGPRREKLVPADLPIAQFRRALRRERKQSEADPAADSEGLVTLRTDPAQQISGRGVE